MALHASAGDPSHSDITVTSDCPPPSHKASCEESDGARGVSPRTPRSDPQLELQVPCAEPSEVTSQSPVLVTRSQTLRGPGFCPPHSFLRQDSASKEAVLAPGGSDAPLRPPGPGGPSCPWEPACSQAALSPSVPLRGAGCTRPASWAQGAAWARGPGPSILHPSQGLSEGRGPRSGSPLHITPSSHSPAWRKGHRPSAHQACPGRAPRFLAQ